MMILSTPFSTTMISVLVEFKKYVYTPFPLHYRPSTYLLMHQPTTSPIYKAHIS